MRNIALLRELIRSIRHTMQRVLVILLLLIFSHSSFSQYLPERPDSLVTKKNSLGIYLTAPVAALLGGWPSSPRAGLIYRRQGSPYRLFRVQAIADFYDVDDASDEMLDVINKVTDSTIVYRWKNDREYRLTARAGLEWSDPQEAITPVYGVDLIVGLNVFNDQRGQVVYERDTLVNDVRPLFSAGGTLNKSTDEVRYQYLIGAAFTAGYRFRVRDTWDFILQLSPEVYYSPYEKVRSYVKAGYSPDTPTSNLWIQVRLLEFQMAYRF